MSETFQYSGVDIVYIRAPNRFRKLLIDANIPKEKRDPWGDFLWETKNPECIDMQKTEFPGVKGTPIGFQSTLDNDIALAWDLRE